MGPVQNKIIRLLACVVALDLTVGVVAVFARDGSTGTGSRESPAPFALQLGEVPTSEATTPDRAGGGAGGILSAGSFANRRRLPQGTTATTAAAPTTTQPPATTPTTAKAPSRATGTAPSGPAAPTLSFDDAAGDTIVDGTVTRRANPRADLVQSRANHIGRAIVLAAKPANAADPGQDPNWTSDSTYLAWEIDTDGDGTPEYEVQWYLYDGAAVAGVSRVGDEDAASVCDAEAGITADGFTVGFEPTCIGNPDRFSYRVTLYYDTDPADEAADVFSDVAPDGGFSRPVSRPAG